MKRRQFMCSVAVLGLPAAGALTSDADGLSALADCELARFLGSENTLKLGRLYCAGYPAEAHVDSLARTLQTTLSTDAGSFAEVVANEFATADTVRLDGWVLSRTEARQAALYSILNS